MVEHSIHKEVFKLVKHRLLAAVFTAFAGVAIGAALALGSRPGAVSAGEPASPAREAPPSLSSSAASPVSETGEEDQRYLIRDYNGRIAVFLEGMEEPELIFDIYTKTLPELDQQQLSQGIVVVGYQRMTRLVEDYTS